MLIEKKEVDRLKSLVGDIRAGVLLHPVDDRALYAFFVENPHLLMIRNFDEHMQVSSDQLSVLAQRALGCEEHKLPVGDGSIACPHLEFRTREGRWAGLCEIPSYIDSHGWGLSHFQFSFESRRTSARANELDRRRRLQPIQDLRDERGTRSDVMALVEALRSDAIYVSMEELIAELEKRLVAPRDSESVLWSPKLWTPNEQARQRALLDQSLAPHLDRWRADGVCFDDLNPSEFEDLVGEVLFSAGLKIHKVREVPQGGRDLIARGTLIPDEEPIEIAVEVKHRRTVDRPDVQLALYQNRAYPALLFVTSGKFTAGVFAEKASTQNRFRLLLKDGIALGDLVRSHFSLSTRSS